MNFEDNHWLAVLILDGNFKNSTEPQRTQTINCTYTYMYYSTQNLTSFPLFSRVIIKYAVCSMCRYVVGLVFGFEHLLLVVAVWLQWVIKPVPKWVRLAIARREYLNKQRMAAAQAQR